MASKRSLPGNNNLAVSRLGSAVWLHQSKGKDNEQTQHQHDHDGDQPGIQHGRDSPKHVEGRLQGWQGQDRGRVQVGQGRLRLVFGNPKDICVADAKGKEKVAKAELEAGYKPSNKATYEVSVAKAEADYAVAKERCDDLAGNAKDVCVKEAKAAETTAKANAKAQMKTAAANVTAKEKTAEARSDASKKATDAREDATADKRDAEYAVAKEKCDTFSGDAKDQCLNQAKARFGK
ncbi:MAG: hypothetical protein ACYCWC_08755 [Rhodocyclaceae bacterium]